MSQKREHLSRSWEKEVMENVIKRDQELWSMDSTLPTLPSVPFIFLSYARADLALVNRLKEETIPEQGYLRLSRSIAVSPRNGMVSKSLSGCLVGSDISHM